MKTGNLLPPRRQERQVRKLSFRPKGEIFLVPSDSLGMTDLSPSLCGLCASAGDIPIFGCGFPLWETDNTTATYMQEPELG